MSSSTSLYVAMLVTGVVLAAEYAATAQLPLFCETYTHLAGAAKLDGPLSCFDPALVPFRPLQHLFFWLAAESETTAGAALRLPGFLGQWTACLLVFFLTRQLGGKPDGALLAATAFALFPSVKSLVWVAAVAWPGRLVFMLAATSLFLRHLKRPSIRTGAGLLGSFLVALCFLQNCDIPVFIQGLPEALALRGAAGPVKQLRTLGPAWRSYSAQLVTHGELDAILDSTSSPFIVYDRDTHSVARVR